MIEQQLLRKVGEQVGAELQVKVAPGGCLIVPVEWAKHRFEPFWVYARNNLPLAPGPIEAALALVHVHGRWIGRGSGRSRTQPGQAADWLRETLKASGPLPYPEVRRLALEAGRSWDTVRKSSQRVGIRKFKENFRGPWVWDLPVQASRPLGQ